MTKPAKSSQIRITVGLDEKRVPTTIDWDADDRPNPGQPVACKAMLLSLFERDNLDTLKIDLWTQDMQVNEMDRFFFQTLRAMADTYFKATQNKEVAVAMQQFVQYFGEKTALLKSEG
ncbi:MAG: gliding motility protein GldC [Lewinellaceae bacterium]|nr:gliding motility protein GldC [Saprospiraceae bacterium]MCB9340274.1 gliding motility protein GldC [Lewinellaceae bacterium]